MSLLLGCQEIHVVCDEERPRSRYRGTPRRNVISRSEIGSPLWFLYLVEEQEEICSKCCINKDLLIIDTNGTEQSVHLSALIYKMKNYDYYSPCSGVPRTLPL